MGDGTLVLHNGSAVPDGRIPITDPMVVRGDGCFEAMRSYGGAMFGLVEHLDRLRASADSLEIDLPARDEIEEWARQVALDRGDGVVRVFASQDDAGTNVYAYSGPLPPTLETLRLLPVEAPWHPAGASWALAGVKTLSYAPNMAATRAAKAEGFDEALLVSSNGTVLEGPTSGILWVVDGVIETPGLDLGILASVTMRFALEQARRRGLQVLEGRFPLSRLAAASEVAILSTTKEVTPVVAVGTEEFEAGPITKMLAEDYDAEVARLQDALSESIR